MSRVSSAVSTWAGISGRPVTAAGEWHPGGLVLLTAWQGDRAVLL